MRKSVNKHWPLDDWIIHMQVIYNCCIHVWSILNCYWTFWHPTKRGIWQKATEAKTVENIWQRFSASQFLFSNSGERSCWRLKLLRACGIMRGREFVLLLLAAGLTRQEPFSRSHAQPDVDLSQPPVILSDRHVRNLTVAAGATARLPCAVENIEDQAVSTTARADCMFFSWRKFRDFRFCCLLLGNSLPNRAELFSICLDGQLEDVVWGHLWTYRCFTSHDSVDSPIR